MLARIDNGLLKDLCEIVLNGDAAASAILTKQGLQIVWILFRFKWWNYDVDAASAQRAQASLGKDYFLHRKELLSS